MKQVSVLDRQRYLSPLRYPGGKACLAPLLTRLLENNSLRNCEYYEPFAGGAGAALRLLRDGFVSTLHLNDADVRIHAFWSVVFTDNERFADAVAASKPSIAEWRKQSLICANIRQHSSFAIAFATFFLNRVNRSGVISGARPIGGMKQTGPFKLDARYNADALSARIRGLAPFRNSVRLYNQDALAFLRQWLPRGRGRSKVFTYLDPPYYSKGSRLYLNYYKDVDHTALAEYMLNQKCLPWLMSYDDQPEIRRLYGSYVRTRIGIDYSLQVKRKSRELLIAPLHIAIPRPSGLRPKTQQRLT